jgi:hypothetical protein
LVVKIIQFAAKGPFDWDVVLAHLADLCVLSHILILQGFVLPDFFLVDLSHFLALSNFMISFFCEEMGEVIRLSIDVGTQDDVLSQGRDLSLRQ